MKERFRALGFRALGFGALGFRALGFRALALRVLGFKYINGILCFPMLWDSGVGGCYV